ncbi:MAG: aldehyde ferredoxin oxidoreductase family protein [Candidatus Bathyarchaeota archaeon]|uniref:aldehyde ferredoxin oxidoreductase family protein n=1 Tax=Candidatus Bathycorpusculum sp. TaxID=2994959 RepID=UPI0028225687|nr:aldehyde ferredoxin oxidoreductase family protein [Candidatus Termiticorpusculum sp.]MCL2257549.1 aldehyde ferredoxin oxidoreductase family protein [Candidatus Termiticorpusculum sp.]MCL2292317.1 aldehyde ferredoxin oxidoreductase family protein [Candidatus Termiticorpusculum sp.]
MLGYAGRILYLDLTTGKNYTEKLNEETAKKFVGGIGLGMYLYLSKSKKGVNPLSPENPLVLSVGPLTATMFPTGGNGHAFISKSPATGGVGESVSHGTFGTELKRAGYDAVVLTGKAEKPLYLLIDDDSIELRDASKLWGKSSLEVEDLIKDEIGDFYVRVASIGLAGEKLSKISCIINDKTRAAGRTGLGAVMGSKNLKAIAVRGTNDITISKPEEFFNLVKEFHERMKGPAAQKYRTTGSTENLMLQNNMFCVPTRNYNNSHFELAENISSSVINQHFIAKIIGCNSCAMRCEHVAIIKDGAYRGTTARIEYDNLWAFGPNCGIDKLNPIIKAAERCNYFGLDAQSVGGVVSFIMDCYEKGLVTKEKLDGIDAHFGNASALLALIEKIGKQEGIGAMLANGVKEAAAKIGGNAEQLAQHIKGLEVTGYDLRCLKTTALSCAVAFRGADHNRSGAVTFDLRGKVDRLKAETGRGKLVKDLEDQFNIIDSLLVCKNSKGTFYKDVEEMAKIYNAATGLGITQQELELAGERIQALAKIINTREGLTRKDDTLPWKVINQPISDDGPVKGAVVSKAELDLMLNDYYQARGYDKQGLLTIAKLQELGLTEYLSIIEHKE